VKYFAVGNEAWGCGGDMRPEFYADQYRRYNVFLKNYPGNSLYRVACGPSEDDYDWTQKVMSIVGNRMNGLSMHYYTFKNGWGDKGSATDFDEADWKQTLGKAMKTEELIRGHSAIMDRYDPERKIGLLVDEWGVWHNNTPGTNPGFLQQQNTMRDAVVAALSLHIFQAHADRVQMSNIAQMINVLQAMIFTDGPRMVLTPTYHVFDMLKVHQDATSLPVDVAGPDYVKGPLGVPQVSASASRSGALIHVSLVNTDPENPIRISCSLPGVVFRTVTGTVLTAPTMQAHNSFETPAAVAPAPLQGITVKGDAVSVDLPSKCVAILEVAP
jgi:alpha-N-arabinofuranosidase